jgi:hypothetical protein
MLQAIVNRAQRSIDTLIAKYVTRVAVAVPFVIALGFGTAGLTAKLVETYGNIAAYALVAAIFAGLGLIAAAVIALSGSNPMSIAAPESANESADDTASTSSQDTRADTELLLTAIGAVGPAMLPALIRGLVRNVPLVVGVIVLAYLLFAEAKKSTSAQTPTAT